MHACRGIVYGPSVVAVREKVASNAGSRAGAQRPHRRDIVTVYETVHHTRGAAASELWLRVGQQQWMLAAVGDSHHYLRRLETADDLRREEESAAQSSRVRRGGTSRGGDSPQAPSHVVLGNTFCNNYSHLLTQNCTDRVQICATPAPATGLATHMTVLLRRPLRGWNPGSAPFEGSDAPDGEGFELRVYVRQREEDTLNAPHLPPSLVTCCFRRTPRHDTPLRSCHTWSSHGDWYLLSPRHVACIYKMLTRRTIAQYNNASWRSLNRHARYEVCGGAMEGRSSGLFRSNFVRKRRMRNIIPTTIGVPQRLVVDPPLLVEKGQFVGVANTRWDEARGARVSAPFSLAGTSTGGYQIWFVRGVCVLCLLYTSPSPRDRG